MKDLSISQSYLICVLNENGKLPALNTEIPVCLLAGALIDLLFSKSIVLEEDKKLYIADELSEEMQYLKSLYTFISESKPMKADKLASEYVFTFSDQRLKLLLKDVGSSLAELNYVTAKNGGLFGKTLCFISDPQIVDYVIQNIRTELLKNGSMSDNIISLVSLMDKSNQIKRYFSAYEKDQLKTHLKEIKNSDSHKLVKEMVDYVDTMITIIVATNAAH